MKKFILLGTLLILYSMFLTPCYWEPSDAIISTTYLALVYENFDNQTAQVIASIWMLSGYLALIFGVLLIGMGARKYFPYARVILQHPIAVIIAAFLFTLLLLYFFNQFFSIFR